MDYAERYGQWALVLGGSEGLGRAIGAELAARGMNVALAARRQGPLDEGAAAIANEYGVETRTLALDLASPDVVDQIEAGMGGEDVSFIAYNAAAEPYGEFVDLEMADHDLNLAVDKLMVYTGSVLSGDSLLVSDSPSGRVKSQILVVMQVSNCTTSSGEGRYVRSAIDANS